MDTMLTVEDVLAKMHSLIMEPDVHLDAWSVSFITNVHQHAAAGRPLSTEQSRITLRLARKLRPLLTNISASDIDDLLRQPVYRQTPYQSANIPREVRYLGDGHLAFRFKYNEIIIREIKALGLPKRHFQEAMPRWNKEHRLWIVQLTRDKVKQVIQIISRNRFEFDDEVAQAITDALNGIGEQCEFILDGDHIDVRIPDNEFVVKWVRGILRGETLL